MASQVDPVPPAASPAGSAVSVTAVVVQFRGGDHLDRCVEACLATDRISEVVVVDNEGVGDELRARFPHARVTVVDMPDNVGYGIAANAGIALARSPSVLVLNQDVVLPAATLEAMLAVGAETGAWIVAPRLHDVDGVERSRKGGFPPPLRWTPPAAGGEDWRAAPYVAGAVMLLMPGHTDLRFDERFFMYGEDEDICFRVWAAGGRVVALEKAWALHIGATATSAEWSERRTAARVLLGRGRFVRKHAGWWGALRWASGVGVSIVRAKAGQAR